MRGRSTYRAVSKWRTIKNARRVVAAVIGAAFLLPSFGCTPSQMPYVFLQYGQEFRQLDLVKVLADNPLKPDENIKLITLGQGQGASHHVVQIRDREPAHMHKAHDATVLVTRGRGYLIMAKRRITLSAGDVVYIPRGTPHYYVNTDLEPTVALVIYAPPFDGKDNVPATMP
jgi:mannose-6-phosphate isomerase-like protein (cupin superfamily)